MNVCHAPGGGKAAPGGFLQGKRRRIIAGGTLVVADLNYGNLAAQTLISLDRLGLDTIKVAAGKVTLGAMVTMAQIGARCAARISSSGRPLDRRPGGAGHGDHRRQSLCPVPLWRHGGGSACARCPGGARRDGTADEDHGDRGFPPPAGETCASSVVLSITFSRPPKDSFRFIKAIRRQPVSAAVVTIAALLPRKRRKARRRAHRLWRDGADADQGSGRRGGTRRQDAR